MTGRETTAGSDALLAKIRADKEGVPENAPLSQGGEQAVESEGEFLSELERLKLLDYKQDIAARKDFSGRLYSLVKRWLVGIGALLVLSGWRVCGFNLSDGVLVALIGGTTVTVVGLFLVVVKYLFPDRK